MSQASSPALTVQELIWEAERKLPPEIWDYVRGGAETETTLLRNRAALDSVALLPRILRDVSEVDISTSLLGHALSLPVILAPIGSLSLLDPGGALASARAATLEGTAAIVSIMAQQPIEEIAAASTGPLFFQLYVRGDDDWIERTIRRAEVAGYRALCITADSAVFGRRERDLVNRFSSGKAADRANLGPEGRDVQIAAHQARLTWSSLARIRSMTRLPIMLKGVMTPDDARLAVEHGVEVVYVSNHGGRQLDHGPGTLDQLPAIVEAVAGRAEIVVDGGFTRGTDVVKALCLGANCVALGKLQAFALAAGGEEGVRRALTILVEEIRVAMGLAGSSSVAELGPESVQPDRPVRAPTHYASCFDPNGRPPLRPAASS